MFADVWWTESIQQDIIGLGLLKIFTVLSKCTKFHSMSGLGQATFLHLPEELH